MPRPRAVPLLFSRWRYLDVRENPLTLGIRLTNGNMAKSDELPAITAKIAAALAVKPQVFITHPVELRILKSMTDAELEEYAAEHGWRIVRRLGGRQIEFYNDVTVRPPEDKSRLT